DAAAQGGHSGRRAAAGHGWKENFRPARRGVLHGNLHFAAIRGPSHILRDEPHHGRTIWVCALRHLSMPEDRSRWSSRVYGRNVGEAIGASTGGVKRMLITSPHFSGPLNKRNDTKISCILSCFFRVFRG